jgi:flagellar basal body-associated protein FliL
VSPLLLFALSDATKTTIVFVLLWVILFPAFVTGLIAFAFVMSRGEAADNNEARRYPRF